MRAGVTSTASVVAGALPGGGAGVSAGAARASRALHAGAGAPASMLNARSAATTCREVMMWWSSPVAPGTARQPSALIVNLLTRLAPPAFTPIVGRCGPPVRRFLDNATHEGATTEPASRNSRPDIICRQCACYGIMWRPVASSATVRVLWINLGG